MFRIPVGDIMSSFDGDTKEFSFDGAIYDGYFPDISFLENLKMVLTMVSLPDGIEVIFHTLSTRVRIEEKVHTVTMWEFSRTWKRYIDPLSDPDDIRAIEPDMSIDLAPVIREEIIMATF